MKILATIEYYTNGETITTQEWYDMDDVKNMVRNLFYTKNSHITSYVTVPEIELKLIHTGE